MKSVAKSERGSAVAVDRRASPPSPGG
jgi:hypothetical protein